ncbi:MAG TPA: hypothetical protein VGW37_02360 [Terriglobia bacterium]|nr:hypothetical protein [Terriglobia bacterium]
MYGWATAAIVVLLLWLGGRRARAKRERMTDAEVIAIIHRYAHGGTGRDWGEFVDRQYLNPRLERIRKMCWEAEFKVPYRERMAFLDQLEEKLRAGQFN